MASTTLRMLTDDRAVRSMVGLLPFCAVIAPTAAIGAQMADWLRELLEARSRVHPRRAHRYAGRHLGAILNSCRAGSGDDARRAWF